MNDRSYMSDTRKRRFLLLVENGARDLKRWYHLIYYPLICEGYIRWALGHGFLTDKGKELLDSLNKNK